MVELVLTVWVWAKNPYIDDAYLKSSVRQAVRVVERQAPVSLRVRYREVTPEMVRGLNRDARCTGEWVYCPYFKTSGLSLLVVPPYVTKEGRWWYGMVKDICTPRGGVGLVAMQKERSNGESGRKYNVWAAVHELMHLLGGKDRGESARLKGRGCSTMDIGILQCVSKGARPVLLPIDVRRVWSCLKVKQRGSKTKQEEL